MGTFARKRFLVLDKPDGQDFTADRERILKALEPEKVSMTYRAMKTLYPLVHDADYKITVTMCPGDNGWDITRVEPGDTTGRLYGLALDLGSTTLELELLNLNTGEVLANFGCVNSQTQFGTNILDRIIAVRESRDNLTELQRLVTGDITGLINKCCEHSGVLPEEIAALVVGGNTTMIHFLMGCDPWLVFQNPYAPVFFDPGIIAAGEIGLPLSCNMFCMPAVANYLGGDITSGLLMTDIDVRSDPGMMLDIGTNGELVLGCRDFMLVGAGAAGPALEGYGSKYGMRAGKGAVRGCRIDCDGNIILDVIGGGRAEGICGTGIVDLIAQGYLSGWINGNGTLNYEASSRIIPVWNQERQLQVPAIVFAETNGEKLYFTQDDIIEFIKCKAAAHTMVATMLDYCGMQPDEIGTLYLSGGFGTNLNLESAITIGLYPDLPRDKFEILGNSSLSGAKKLLLDDSCADRLRHITEMAVYVQFGEMEKFLENMIAAQFIPHTDERLYPSVKRRI